MLVSVLCWQVSGMVSLWSGERFVDVSDVVLAFLVVEFFVVWDPLDRECLLYDAFLVDWFDV